MVKSSATKNQDSLPKSSKLKKVLLMLKNSKKNTKGKVVLTQESEPIELLPYCEIEMAQYTQSIFTF
jgi:hypothetical protein